VAKEDRGFASMDRAKQREIASKGGKAAHQKGTAHEWTSEEARDAGRKGGIASHQRRREQSSGPGENAVAMDRSESGSMGSSSSDSSMSSERMSDDRDE
jgi:general stress protein YciG